MNGPGYLHRLEGVRAALESESIDAMLVTDLVNVRYLTGYDGSNGLVVVHGGGATFMTDFRYVTAAEPIAEIMDVRMLEGETSRFLGEHLNDIAPGANRIGVEAAHVSVATHNKLEAALGDDRELVATADVVETLRLVKDAYELDAIRRSAALISPVYQTIADEGLGGKREVDVAWRVRELFREQGADDLSFDTIVASHERGAMPHVNPVRVGDLCRHTGDDRSWLLPQRLCVRLHAHVRRGRARCGSRRDLRRLPGGAADRAGCDCARRGRSRGGRSGARGDHRSRPRRPFRPRPRPRCGAGDTRGPAAFDRVPRNPRAGHGRHSRAGYLRTPDAVACGSRIS